MGKSAILVLSGGMDSAVLFRKLYNEGYELKAISFDYGQKHAERELCFAKQAAESLGVEHKVIDLKVIQQLFGNSALTNQDTLIPSGHYTDESMKVTVVPNRNMIMLSLAAAWAMASKFKYVAYAAHSGDHAIYPDCRSEFAEALDKTIQLADWHSVSLLRPFVSMDKSEICKLGSELKVDFGKTWSCYRGGAQHCGNCGTCVERKEAFFKAEVEDPTEYEA